MKKYSTLLLLLFSLCIVACKESAYTSQTGTIKTKKTLEKNSLIFCKDITTLDSLSQKKASTVILQNQFKKARLSYKRLESITAFYFPETSKKINGAAINENDVNETSRKQENATGFQKVEEILFSDQPNLKELSIEIGILKGYTLSLNQSIKNLQLSDSNIFESQKLELVRIMSLGISGFDSPIALHAIPETKEAISSILETLSYFANPTEFKVLQKNTLNYLTLNINFDTFDRAHFINQYAIPLYQKIHQIQQNLKIKGNPYPGAINLNNPSVFNTNSFNVNYFAPSYNKNASVAQIALGKQLFFDPILSGNNKVACASCHIPDQGYADHKKTAVNNNSSRNTPTLLASGFQNVLFLDGRVSFLEDQAKTVINNKDEMHGNFAIALKKVAQNKNYQTAFKKVFPTQTTITEESFLKSIASYVRSLEGLNSKFDSYLQNKTTLTEREKNGFNLFMGKGKCATCHFFPLFNGSVPPMYNKTETEVLGVPSHNTTTNATIDPDFGEYAINKSPLKKYAFKTPTVRNTAITYPYMHNGVYNTLEEVLIFYNKGGGAGIGINITNQTLPSTALNLSETEIKDIISFIKTLNSSY